MSKSSDPINNAIMAVAGIEGCDAVSWNLMWEKDYSALDASAQFAYVADRVQSLAEYAAKACKVQAAGHVPVEPLKRFFAN